MRNRKPNKRPENDKKKKGKQGLEKERAERQKSWHKTKNPIHQAPSRHGAQLVTNRVKIQLHPGESPTETRPPNLHQKRFLIQTITTPTTKKKENALLDESSPLVNHFFGEDVDIAAEICKWIRSVFGFNKIL